MKFRANENTKQLACGLAHALAEKGPARHIAEELTASLSSDSLFSYTGGYTIECAQDLAKHFAEEGGYVKGMIAELIVTDERDYDEGTIETAKKIVCELAHRTDRTDRTDRTLDLAIEILRRISGTTIDHEDEWPMNTYLPAPEPDRDR